MIGGQCGRGGRRGIALHAAGPFDAGVIAGLHLQCFADGSVSPMAVFRRWQCFADGSVSPMAVFRRWSRWRGVECGVDRRGFVAARQLRLPGRGGAGTGHGARCVHAHARAARTLLEVAEDNMAARNLYAAEGFAPVKRWPRYYRRPGGQVAAALVFARDLL